MRLRMQVMVRKTTNFARAGILTLLVSLTGHTWGCQCDEATIADHIDSAKRVFIGRLLKAEVQLNDIESIDGTFSPLRIFKGNADSSIQIKWTWSTCSFPATIGLIYIIFESADGRTNACAGSRPIDELVNYENDESVRQLREAFEQSSVDISPK